MTFWELTNSLGPNQPPIYLVPVALSPGVKLAGDEASAEIKKKQVYTSTPSYVFKA
jgi:hypothetical protein